MSSVTFNNLVLADGQVHKLLFHLQGLQNQGQVGVELHLDCRLVETVRDLPAVFQGLPAAHGIVGLKTMQPREQVIHLSHLHTIVNQCSHMHNKDYYLFTQQEVLEELKLAVGDSFENVASLQGCHFQQRDSVQTLGMIPISIKHTHWQENNSSVHKNEIGITSASA